MKEKTHNLLTGPEEILGNLDILVQSLWELFLYEKKKKKKKDTSSRYASDSFKCPSKRFSHANDNSLAIALILIYNEALYSIIYDSPVRS